MRQVMFLVAMVAVLMVGGAAQAGPFGLFGGGRCGGCQTARACQSAPACAGVTYAPVSTPTTVAYPSYYQSQPAFDQQSFAPRVVVGGVIQSAGGVVTNFGQVIQAAGATCAGGRCQIR